MKLSYLSAVAACLLLGASWGAADSQKPSSPPAHITNGGRIDIIRGFNAELVYVRTAFPMGQNGLKLKNGTISPDAKQLQETISLWGQALKPGDQAQITSVTFIDNRIHFELNGGPIKKKKWYQHIVISGASGDIPLDQGDTTNNIHGTFLDLVFDHYIPQMSVDQLKETLRPVFDFNSKSILEAYLETIPPKAKDAIKKHQVLVGMNREMVIYAKGRPPKKTREKDGEDEYEEWIYGDPPDDVDFVRFMGDYVVRVETMKVTGEKVVRTEKEVDLEPQPTVASGEPAARPPGAPSLRRPGEAPDPSGAPPNASDQPSPVPMGPPGPPGPPGGSGGAPPPQ